MINEGSGKTICTYKVMRKVKFLGVLLGFVWKRGIQRGEKFLVGRWQCVQALASQCPGPCDYQEEPLSNLFPGSLLLHRQFIGSLLYLEESHMLKTLKHPVNTFITETDGSC